jgi:hypothetical protein
MLTREQLLAKAVRAVVALVVIGLGLAGVVVPTALLGALMLAYEAVSAAVFRWGSAAPFNEGVE